ncbi:CheB methylesterase [Sphingobacterium allocomposti]|uniref:protein-glutamate methylesterase n=2 Tax=Sphingobacterium allocomposti TaxID=415956 RepID=A0A5S5DTA8_9SPHI|nr:CheB methylesterase [Sphingobacterium composti Yoo et al. 2007 non Ten et al. 2007]
MNKAKDIVLIGGSAGSYTLIVQILEALPQRFDAAIAIVIHRNPRFTTKIEETLSIKLRRSVIQPRDKTAIAPNIIYFAGPGYHLLVEPDWTFSVDVSERIHFSRPSIDVLFDTAAEVYQDRCTAFLLSGANQDGADGIRRVREMGGKAIIQSPDDALIATMPTYAIQANAESDVYDDQQIISFFRKLT